MDPELRDLWRGYRDEQRRMADDPEPCEPAREQSEHDEQEQGDETETATCPFGREWCDPSANLSSDGGFPCLSCQLRTDRDDDPHPNVATAADYQGRKR